MCTFFHVHQIAYPGVALCFQDGLPGLGTAAENAEAARISERCHVTDLSLQIYNCVVSAGYDLCTYTGL